nr:putative reverse transcriptase, RNA-dependent DNA polymerase [Tanacetum cinerariifolium]
MPEEVAASCAEGYGKSKRCDSALTAELQAIRLACAFAANKGWVNAIIESDSQTAITLATMENIPPWALSALIMDIRYWASHLNLQLYGLPTCKLSYMPEEVAASCAEGYEKSKVYKKGPINDNGGFPHRGSTQIICDNKAAIQISKNPVQHDRTKQVEVDRHFIKEKLEAGIIELPTSAMANTTPLVTTVTKPTINPGDADTTPRVNIQEFCEEYYEDILLIIMEKVRHDRRKNVHT